MNKTNQILAGLVVAQFALIALTWAGAGQSGGDDANALVPAEVDSVTAIEITGKPAKAGEASKTVKLSKKGDKWVVSSAADFPAKKDKVEEVVKKLVEAKVRAPVATNKANHAALKVADGTFDKKVTISAGGSEHKLVVGSGKSSSIHARFADKDEVYLARGISAWAISDRIASYVDTQYVKVDDPTEVRVQNPKGTISIHKDADKMVVAELPPDANVDDSRVTAFVNSAKSLRMAEPVGREIKPEYGLDGGTKVVLKGKDVEVKYTIGAKAGDEDKYYAKAEGNDFVVLVNKWSVDKLNDQTPDKFIKEVAAPAPPGGPPGGMPGGMPQGLPPGFKIPGR